MNLNLTANIKMPEHQLRRQVIDLCIKTGKPLLKLSTKSPLKKSRMLNGLTVVSGSRDIRIVKLLCIINVKNLHISLIFSTLAENFCNAWRL